MLIILLKIKKQLALINLNRSIVGGARRDRTADLLRARQALSQLSYGPFAHHFKVVGLGRFELPTSPLSGVRSNQLSYRPKTSCFAEVTTSTTSQFFLASFQSDPIYLNSLRNFSSAIKPTNLINYA